jgi:cytoskeleton protein RodZ
MDRHAKTGKTSSPAGPPVAGIDPAEFAEYLRAERERRRLTLDQIADETKIASRHLAALERGDVRNWPGGMYRRAMMRAYAESIGVDREFALKQFERAFDQESAPPPQAAAPEAAALREVPRWRPSRAQLTIAFSSLVLVAAIWAAWTVAGDLMARSTQPAAAALAPAAAPPAPVAPAPASEAVPAPVVVATTGSPDPRPVPTEGNLVVTSEPAGARVTVNGIGWGDTPVTIRHLELGEKRVRVTLPGHVSQERVVRLGPERPNANVRLTLPERPRPSGSER